MEIRWHPPGRELRGGVGGGVGLAPGGPKWAEIFGDPGRARPGFRFFPEWSGMVPLAPRIIIWGPGVGRDYYLGILGWELLLGWQYFPTYL